MPRALEKNDALPESTNDVLFVHPLNSATVMAIKIKFFVFLSKNLFQPIMDSKYLENTIETLLN